jgi:hypothetical protein
MPEHREPCSPDKLGLLDLGEERAEAPHTLEREEENQQLQPGQGQEGQEVHIAGLGGQGDSPSFIQHKVSPSPFDSSNWHI